MTKVMKITELFWIEICVGDFCDAIMILLTDSTQCFHRNRNENVTFCLSISLKSRESGKSFKSEIYLLVTSKELLYWNQYRTSLVTSVMKLGSSWQIGPNISTDNRTKMLVSLCRFLHISNIWVELLSAPLCHTPNLRCLCMTGKVSQSLEIFVILSWNQWMKHFNVTNSSDHNSCNLRKQNAESWGVSHFFYKSKTKVQVGLKVWQRRFLYLTWQVSPGNFDLYGK